MTVPEWNSQNPADWGWTHGDHAQIVPFAFDGHAFPGGVALGTEKYFTRALDRLVSQAGFSLPASRSLDAGMWGYEDRPIGGTNRWSFHAYGLAIDIAAPWNPQGSSQPSQSPHRLPLQTAELIRDLGFVWGGSWSGRPDWMHIELHLSKVEVVTGWGLFGAEKPAVVTDSGSWPLPAGYYFGPYEGPEQSISGSGRNDARYRPALARAQTALGVIADGYYGPNTAAALRSFQLPRGLEVDGLLGPATWSALDL
jgi:peptidoglycan hydrolase-like protein with peptidoglycan-binding domain